MNNIPIKDLTAGATVHILIKGDNLAYKQGSIVNIGMQRMDVPANPSALTALQAVPKYVVDVTYNVDGKSYTDAVGITDTMMQTDKLGGVSLITTDRDNILRELRTTLKIDEDYLASVDDEKAKREKRVSQCRDLIGELDTEFAAKRKADERVQRLEDSIGEIKEMLAKLAANK